MLSFKSFIFLSEADINKDEDGNIHYTSSVGEHKVATRFFHNGNDRYEVGFDVNGSDQTRERNKLTPEERQQAVLHVVRHVRHFINNSKPLELEAKGNTEEKKKFYSAIFQKAREMYPGSQTTGTRIKFQPSNEKQKSYLQSVRMANVAKMKELASRRQQMNT